MKRWEDSGLCTWREILASLECTPDENGRVGDCVAGQREIVGMKKYVG